MSVEVTGIQEALDELNEQIKDIKGKSIEGLIAAGLIIEADAKRKAPVLTGNLRASGFSRKDPTDPEVVEVGFNAAYAIFVHEDLEAHHTNGEAKFLENAVKENSQRIVDIITSRAKRGPD